MEQLSLLDSARTRKNYDLIVENYSTKHGTIPWVWLGLDRLVFQWPATFEQQHKNSFQRDCRRAAVAFISENPQLITDDTRIRFDVYRNNTDVLSAF